MNRRNFLHNSAAFAAGAVFSQIGSPVSAAQGQGRSTVPSPSRKRVLRAAHFTDLHVMPDREGFQSPAAGMTAALRHAQGQPDRPEILLFGGDLVMDSLKHSKEEVNAQWDVWQKVFAAEVKLPYKLCLGNHDVWGWALHEHPELERDPLFGKELAMQRLGIKERYYSYDQAGWHFVVLDSMQRDFGNKHGYTARLDDEQFAWLAKDLAATPASTPIAILSHIPILACCVFFDDDLEATGSWVIPGAWCHIDARRLKDLFHKHPNVKTCISGHVHLVDDVTYLGVRYLCNGAICGAWWKGAYQEFAPAYALVDFYDDGSVENQLIAYGENHGGVA
ncbi:metallophosphoesterase [Opitutaceae bacterium EW11]|nr:metallophosphoesterase [Opitutaceae bacterium EW11]